MTAAISSLDLLIGSGLSTPDFSFAAVLYIVFIPLLLSLFHFASQRPHSSRKTKALLSHLILSLYLYFMLLSVFCVGWRLFLKEDPIRMLHRYFPTLQSAISLSHGVAYFLLVALVLYETIQCTLTFNLSELSVLVVVSLSYNICRWGSRGSSYRSAVGSPILPTLYLIYATIFALCYYQRNSVLSDVLKDTRDALGDSDDEAYSSEKLLRDSELRVRSQGSLRIRRISPLNKELTVKGTQSRVDTSVKRFLSFPSSEQLAEFPPVEF